MCDGLNVVLGALQDSQLSVRVCTWLLGAEGKLIRLCVTIDKSLLVSGQLLPGSGIDKPC